MELLWQGLLEALQLLIHRDPEVAQIAARSLATRSLPRPSPASLVLLSASLSRPRGFAAVA
jgi:ABC-type tungstate transport system substrate-binding protein